MNATYDFGPSISATTIQPETAEVRRIAPGEAVLLVEAGYATLVEARWKSVLSWRHIEGAVSLVIDDAATPVASMLGEVPAHHLVILYCADPDACVVVAVARFLIDQGWDPRRLAILVGDREAWLGVGLPVLRRSVYGH